ncbi:hypothetical protein, partial [Dichelobacter nodosus]|uniref:hypothetical protein n=1 Tax=Dichelobacter nodosus TaxID=870 RepID=UPI001F1CE0BB
TCSIFINQVLSLQNTRTNYLILVVKDLSTQNLFFQAALSSAPFQEVRIIASISPFATVFCSSSLLFYQYTVFSTFLFLHYAS